MFSYPTALVAVRRVVGINATIINLNNPGHALNIVGNSQTSNLKHESERSLGTEKTKYMLKKSVHLVQKKLSIR